MALSGYNVNVVFVNIPEPFSPSGAINRSEGLKKNVKIMLETFP